MNAEHPADYSPLSYGAALAMGLMLLLGLPVEAKKPPVKASSPAQRPLAGGARLAACGLTPISGAQPPESAGCTT